MATANTTIARPYAKAVFELALAQGQLTQWSAMLQLLATLCEEPQAAAFLAHPALSPKQRIEFLLEIVHTQLTQACCNFVAVLAFNKRLAVLPEIFALFELQRAEQEHTVDVEVVVAQPLTNSQQQQLIDSLRRRLQREVSLQITVDKNILGGAIIRAGDLVIDGSIRSKLNRLSSTIAA